MLSFSLDWGSQPAITERGRASIRARSPLTARAAPAYTPTAVLRDGNNGCHSLSPAGDSSGHCTSVS